MDNLTKLNWMLEEKNDKLNNLLERIKDGTLSRLHIEEIVKNLIKENKLCQKWSNNL